MNCNINESTGGKKTFEKHTTKENIESIVKKENDKTDTRKCVFDYLWTVKASQPADNKTLIDEKFRASKNKSRSVESKCPNVYFHPAKDTVKETVKRTENEENTKLCPNLLPQVSKETLSRKSGQVDTKSVHRAVLFDHDDASRGGSVLRNRRTITNENANPTTDVSQTQRHEFSIYYLFFYVCHSIIYRLISTLNLLNFGCNEVSGFAFYHKVSIFFLT